MTAEVLRLPLGVCVVRSRETVEGGSRLQYSLGIARETVGAQQLAMSLVIVPPAAAARPHYHLAGETIIHVLEGRAETRFGAGLRQSAITAPGDFMYIAAHMPHQPINLSATERGVAINARTDPAQQEPLVPVDESTAMDADARGLVTLRGRVLTLAPGERMAEFGATGQTVGARGLCVLRFVLAPQAQTRPHAHPFSETGVYVVSGEVETRFGDALEQRVMSSPDEFLFLPVGVKHQVVNRSAEPAVLVLARSDADEAQDTVEFNI